MQNNGNWKCISLKDQSTYYGEISYMKPSGEILTEEALSNEEKQHFPKVRHGQGVQLFSSANQGTLCKYQGSWVKDKKHGKGECFYPNGDIYKGEFQNDKRHGVGCYTWQDGKKYDGEWKNDRMEGIGCFTYPSSSSEIQGEFKANYYVLNSDLILNPFIEGDDMNEEIHLQEEARKKNAKFFEAQHRQVKIHRLASPAELPSTISSIDKTSRVAAIITSSQSYLHKSDILKCMPGQIQEIDLKYLVTLRKAEGREKTREFLRSICMEIFINGGCLFLNLDDSQVKYDELYYPDMQEFFNPRSFPATLFKPDVMKRKEVWKSFCGDEDTEINENYIFVIWSKTKFDEALDDQDLLAKFEKKFSKVFSLDNVDMVFCHNRIEEEPSYRE